MTGELERGDKLPSERELAEQFGVSRTAVREAVKALQEKGLIEVQPGRGTFVTAGTSNAVRQSLGRALQFQPDTAPGELVAVRELLEPQIAAMAAERAQPEHIAAMRRAVDAMDASMEEPERFIEADLNFHLALADATGNSLITLLIDPIVDLLREQRTRIFSVPGGPERGQKHHNRILEAVSSSNPDAAREAMKEHLQQVRDDSGTARASGPKDPSEEAAEIDRRQN